MTQAPVRQTVLGSPAKAAIFLVVTIRDGAEDGVRDFLTAVNGAVRGVRFRIPEAELTAVVGIGSDAWDRLFPSSVRPAQLHPLPELVGSRHTAPSTPGDLLFHIRATRLDVCFELATQLATRLRGLADIVDEVHGFRSFDERDLLGFVDGAESPVDTLAERAAFIGDEDAAFTGGSYVIVQKYLHDLDTWNALPVEAQEHAIGRKKLDDTEFPDDAKPSNSHLALNTIEDADGNQLQIVRDNMPFGRVGSGEFGTYFIGYAKSPSTIERMLRNMFIGVPPGNSDRILDFSTAVTGSAYFVPTADFLDDPTLTLTPTNDQAATTEEPAPGADARSLGIGGISSKGQR
jgi:putative iron-dependent peroxidase